MCRALLQLAAGWASGTISSARAAVLHSRDGVLLKSWLNASCGATFLENGRKYSFRLVFFAVLLSVRVD
jgi:hypothetical protein